MPGSQGEFISSPGNSHCVVRPEVFNYRCTSGRLDGWISDVRFGFKVGLNATKWDKSETCEVIFSEHFGSVGQII